MSRWMINYGRLTCRSLSIPVSSVRRAKVFHHHQIRQISNQTNPNNHHANDSTNSFSDRAIVLGLLTLTTLVGVGMGTRAKCERTSVETIEKTSPNKKSAQTQVEESQTNDQKAENDPNQSEGSEQGAFNPETGEINWDCPCLGGMAHGTCGEQFKAAFSCFVYSEQEPKGVECIEKFKDMQDCFRQNPDEYGPELVDSEEPISEEDITDSSEGALLERSQPTPHPLSTENAPVQSEEQTERPASTSQTAFRKEAHSNSLSEPQSPPGKSTQANSIELSHDSSSAALSTIPKHGDS